MSNEKAPPPAPASSTSRGRFSSALKQPVDMKTIDLKRAERILERLLKSDHAKNQAIISSLVLDHLAAHRLPDAKVLQVDIEELGVLTPHETQRLIKKFWLGLVDDQKKTKDKYHRKYMISPPKESEKRASPAPSAASSGSRSEGFSECWPIQRIEQPAIDSGPPALSFQQPARSFQPSAQNFQPPAINLPPPPQTFEQPPPMPGVPPVWVGPTPDIQSYIHPNIYQDLVGYDIRTHQAYQYAIGQYAPGQYYAPHQVDNVYNRSYV